MHKRAIDRAIRVYRGTYRRSISPGGGTARVYAPVGEGTVSSPSVVREVHGRGATVGCVEIVIPDKDYIFCCTRSRHRLHVWLIHFVAAAEDSHRRWTCEIVRTKDIHTQTD